MNFLIAAAVVFIFASYFIIKSARGSADRGEAPDISNPSSAPDSIGNEAAESSGEGGGPGHGGDGEGGGE